MHGDTPKIQLNSPPLLEYRPAFHVRLWPLVVWAALAIVCAGARGISYTYPWRVLTCIGSPWPVGIRFGPCQGRLWLIRFCPQPNWVNTLFESRDLGPFHYRRMPSTVWLLGVHLSVPLAISLLGAAVTGIRILRKRRQVRVDAAAYFRRRALQIEMAALGQRTRKMRSRLAALEGREAELTKQLAEH
jgi:hypothetical protein